MRGFWKLFSMLAQLLALSRGPGSFARNQARRAVFRGVSRGMRKWKL